VLHRLRRVRGGKLLVSCDVSLACVASCNNEPSQFTTEMLNSLRFQPSNSTISLSFNHPFLTTTKSHSQQRTLSFTTKPLALPQPLSSSQPSSHYISTVGSSSINLSHWNLTQRHLTLLQVLAVVVTFHSLQFRFQIFYSMFKFLNSS
jgi:hypothetical protein